jgi:hypothetical protein
MKHKSFETQRQKIRNTWENTQSNSSEIKNNIYKKTITLKPIHFNKKIVKIPLLEGQLLTSSGGILG